LEKRINACKVLIEKSEGKRQLPRTRQKRENVLTFIIEK
jgi:hypothetical protein